MEDQIRKIFGTIGARYLIAILNLALIFVNAKVLGVEGLGMAGILIAAVNIAVMFNGVLSGNTIVYFMNRYSIHTIFFPAYLWTLVGSALACGLMILLGLLPASYFATVYFLSIITSLVAANSRFLLGKDRIKEFNITFMLQGGLLFFVLLFFYYILKEQNVASYLWGMYITNGIAFIVSLALLLPYLKKNEAGRIEGQPLSSVLKEMFSYGLWGSADNVAEILTTRLNYFLIRSFGGLGSVGILDAGTKISESVWNISRSISFIEYSNVAQSNDPSVQKKITLQLFKLTFCAITFATVCVLMVPEWVYTNYLFSAEFKGMRNVISGLSAGIIAFGCNSILSHYFIGSGKIRYSAICSCIGLASLLVAGYILIPVYGIVGSAISSSVAFCTMLVFSIFIFCRHTGGYLREFLLNKKDIMRVYEYIGKRF